MVLALGGGVYVEGLTLVLRLGVGQVTVDLRLGCEEGSERGGVDMVWSAESIFEKW